MSVEMQRIIKIIEDGAASSMSLEQFIQTQVSEWKKSDVRKLMLLGQQYYRMDNDILKRKRETVGEGGRTIEAVTLANNRLPHGFVRKLVDQKVGYLLSKPLSIQSKDQIYSDKLENIFDKSFLRMLQSVGRESINKGIAWIHVYYNETGDLSFKRIQSEEIIPFWSDAAHTKLDAVIRTYDIETYEGVNKKIVTKVEFWDLNGVRRFVSDGFRLTPDVEIGETATHFTTANSDESDPLYLNWERVPFVCVKYHEDELPLVKFIKELVDDYDRNKSDNSNNLQDLPNSIYVVKNLDGTDLGEFRHNLSVYRTAKVSGDGGLDTLALDLNIEAVKMHLEQNRKDIYEFGRGVDTQNNKFGNSPSGIALRFLFSDLDLDANDIEVEFQASLEQLVWFVDMHMHNSNEGDFAEVPVDFILNRDILINETDTITNTKNSIGIISDETIIANHPWVTNATEEIGRIKKQRDEDLAQAQQYGGLGASDNKDTMP